MSKANLLHKGELEALVHRLKLDEAEERAGIVRIDNKENTVRDRSYRGKIGTKWEERHVWAKIGRV